jgi:hypothetical protein
MHKTSAHRSPRRRLTGLASVMAIAILTIGGCTLPEQMSSSSGGGSSGGGSSGGGSSGGGSSGGGSSGGGSSSGGGGVSIDDLDAELDTSLDDFDSRVGGSGDSSNIDVLDPMGGGGSTYDSSQAIYEELDSGGDSVAERAEQGPGGESSDGAASGGASAESSGGARGGGASAESSGGARGGAGNGGPGGASGAATPLPDDIGDGRGDNIVERQIREAAMRESDPVLREKLWDEYRRVKGQE